MQRPRTLPKVRQLRSGGLGFEPGGLAPVARLSPYGSCLSRDTSTQKG